MRCPQCGNEVAQGAAFCSRCGTRVMTPRPETKHEYALTRILPSWWHFFREIVIACVLAGAGIYRMVTHPRSTGAGSSDVGWSRCGSGYDLACAPLYQLESYLRSPDRAAWFNREPSP